jgi:hypothetical protein
MQVLFGTRNLEALVLRGLVVRRHPRPLPRPPAPGR